MVSRRTWEPCTIRADARVLGASLRAGQRISYSMDDPEQKAYVVTTGGHIVLNGLQLGERDGAAIRGGHALEIEALSDTDIVLVDTV
ncbi:hypothetical protein [Caballeronia sp. dw_19]|uniref:pirin family protein n=1 Tax=Caballeronia sp. dw_19 TaxID=2719791 RepID=UPI003211C4BE